MTLDVEWHSREDGTAVEAIIPLRHTEANALTGDIGTYKMIDEFQSALIGLAYVRTGGPDQPDQWHTPQMHVRRLIDRLEALEGEMILRAHVGGRSLGDMAMSMDVPRGTVQGWRDQARRRAQFSYPQWVRKS